MAEKVILEFAGWIEVSEDTIFEYLGVEDSVPRYITAKEWLALPPDEDEYEDGRPCRDSYILSDTAKAMEEAVDGSFDHHEVLLYSERKERET
jgi:hypothetical protein